MWYSHGYEVSISHSGTFRILIGTSLFSKREAFHTDDFYWQMRMMDAMMTALERSLVGFT